MDSMWATMRRGDMGRVAFAEGIRVVFRRFIYQLNWIVIFGSVSTAWPPAWSLSAHRSGTAGILNQISHASRARSPPSTVSAIGPITPHAVAAAASYLVCLDLGRSAHDCILDRWAAIHRHIAVNSACGSLFFLILIPTSIGRHPQTFSAQQRRGFPGRPGV